MVKNRIVPESPRFTPKIDPKYQGVSFTLNIKNWIEAKIDPTMVSRGEGDRYTYNDPEFSVESLPVTDKQ